MKKLKQQRELRNKARSENMNEFEIAKLKEEINQGIVYPHSEDSNSEHSCSPQNDNHSSPVEVNTVQIKTHCNSIKNFASRLCRCLLKNRVAPEASITVIN